MKWLLELILRALRRQPKRQTLKGIKYPEISEEDLVLDHSEIPKDDETLAKCL